MNKFGSFLGKKWIILVVNRQGLGAPPPGPLASGGWGLRPQTPVQVK